MDHIFILIIAMGTAAACAIPGVFLVLKRKALMSDAIGHAVLPGIVIAFLIVKDIHSPLLIVGAALVGMLTAFLCDMISRTELVKQDAPIVIVFPFLFSIGVILINQFVNNIHLCEDSVLYGNIAFVSFNQLNVFGTDIGPKALYTMLGILTVNTLFVRILFKELQLVTFDEQFALLAGFSPVLVGYTLTFIISITAVGAFNIVGSILIIAFMVIPPSAAHLLTDDLGEMIVFSVLIGMIAGVLGFIGAMMLDTSISGSMAAVAGLILFGAYLFAPKRGMVVKRL